MGLRRTEAIVIGGHNLGEADRIIPFYTRELGLVRAVAQGVRRIRSRFGGTLELFTHGHLVYFERPSRSLHSINEFAVLHPFPGLRDDLDRLAHASCAAELVAASSEEGDPDPNLFAALLQTLGLLDSGTSPDLVLAVFELKALALLGYQPELSVCVACRRALAEGAGAVLNPQRGGLICAACGAGPAAGFAVSAAAIAFLRGAARLDIGTAARAHLPAGAAAELSRALRQYLQHALGRALRSAAFLERISP